MISASNTPLNLIQDTDRFSELCERWSSLPFIAIDTEFIRTNTFYPKIGLLQIADHSECYLIDPLHIQDWSCFVDLLAEPKCTFVIHSCGEDLNLLNTSIGNVPHCVFDTQIAAAFLGMGYSLSYQALVAKLLNTDLSKDETRSNWLNRPLSKAQLLYAANDVCYLLQLQTMLYEKLATMGKLSWLKSECKFLVDSAGEVENTLNWQCTYTNISNAWKLDNKGLQYLQALCYWREDTARKRDKPRNWIAKDADLFSIAQQMAVSSECSLEVINSLRLFDKRLLNKYGGQIFKVLEMQNEISDNTDAQLLARPLNVSMRAKLKACQQVVETQSQKLGIAPELLARKKILQNQLLMYKKTGELLWEGELATWRREILEPEFIGIYSEA